MNSRDTKASLYELRQLASTYREFYSSLRKAKHGVTPLGRMVGDPYKTGDDTWLIKAGIALIAFPDPTITDLIGTGMVMIGLAKKHTTPLTIAEVNRKLRNMMRELRELQLENANGID